MAGSKLAVVATPHRARMSINRLAGKKLGVDASSVLHDGPFSSLDANVKYHEHGDPSLIAKLFADALAAGQMVAKQVQLIPYFDNTCAGKAVEDRIRAEQRADNLVAARVAYAEGDSERAKKLYADTNGSGDRAITQACVNELRGRGVHYVLSAEENDAQMVYDCTAGVIDGIVASDADLFAQGSRLQIVKWGMHSVWCDAIDLDDAPLPGQGYKTPAQAAWAQPMLDLYMAHGRNPMVWRAFATLLGCDYTPPEATMEVKSGANAGKIRRLQKGVHGVGPALASRWLVEACANHGGGCTPPKSAVEMWQWLCAARDRVKLSTGAGAGNGKPIPAPKVSLAVDKSVFLYGMHWFGYQAWYDGSGVARPANTPLSFAAANPVAADALQFCTGSMFELVPITHVVLPQGGAPLLIGDVPELIQHGVLPLDEGQWSEEVVNGYLRTFQGLTGMISRKIELKRAECRRLRDLTHDLRRQMRQDPNAGHLAVTLSEEGGVLPDALQKVVDKLKIKLPEPAQFPATDGTFIANKMAAFPPELVKRWKFYDKEVDGRRATSDDTVEKGHRQYTEFVHDMVPGFRAWLDHDADDAHDWFHLPVPASQTSNKRWPCWLRCVKESGAYTSMLTFCLCPKGDAICHHGVTLVDVAATWALRMQMVEEEERREQEETCTTGPCGWLVGATAGEEADTTPVWRHSYFGVGYGEVDRTKGPAARVTRSEGHFNPLSQANQSLPRDDPERVRRRVAMHKVWRRVAYTTRNKYTGAVVVAGDVVIAQRHAKGLRCQLATDLWEGASSDEEYDYATAEGWPPITAQKKKRKDGARE